MMATGRAHLTWNSPGADKQGIKPDLLHMKVEDLPINLDLEELLCIRIRLGMVFR